MHPSQSTTRWQWSEEHDDFYWYENGHYIWFKLTNPVQPHIGHYNTRAPLYRSDSAPPAQTTKTYQPKEVEQTFQWTLEIPYTDVYGGKKSATALALLDPQTQKGNWISQELLARLNKLSDIRAIAFPPTLDGVSGTTTAAGEIEIEMKRREGNRYYACNCYVLPSEANPKFDVIIGKDFINQHRIMTVNDGAMLPLLEGDKLTPGEQAAIAAAEQERRRQQAELQARRGAYYR